MGSFIVVAVITFHGVDYSEQFGQVIVNWVCWRASFKGSTYCSATLEMKLFVTKYNYNICSVNKEKDRVNGFKK